MLLCATIEERTRC